MILGQLSVACQSASRKEINEIVNGHAPVSADTATRLARLTAIPADAWLRYEALYRADLA